MRPALLGTLLLVAAAAPAPAAAPEGEWRYVLPPPGDAFEHPPLRVLALSEAKPADVVEEAAYRGKHRRYAQLRYGSPDSVRVTVVVDEVGPEDVDLYVDAGRNRRIQTKDRVAGKGLTWRLPLEAAFVEGNTLQLERRAVVFRYGPVSRTLAFAAAGYLEGPVRVGGRTHTGRRADADGNGLYTDPLDRLWIDLDGDGRWDPTSEQFLYAPLLNVGKERFAVRADARGRRLALERLEGTGKLRLAVRPADPRSRVLDLSATLVGRDSSVVSLQGTGEAEVPVGEYRLQTLTVTLADPKGGPRWCYSFSDRGARPGQHWYAVPRDGTLTLDPVGKPDFRTGLKEGAAARAGQNLEFQPELFTGDGLLIVSCVRGTPGGEGRESCFAESVLAAGGERLEAARSGFM
jgi:hypothetical protein